MSPFQAVPTFDPHGSRWPLRPLLYMLCCLLLSTPLFDRAAARAQELATPEPQTVTLAAHFKTDSSPADNIDSLAFWKGENGEAWIIATAKASHRLIIYDATTGATLRTYGGPGRKLGEFQRPNGLIVIDDLLLVCERDNRRVQVLRLPALQPIGSFGEQDLRLPYGLAISRSENRRGLSYEVFVTDNYDSSEEPLRSEELGERVKHFQLEIASIGLRARLLKSFGETYGEGVLWEVESIHTDTQAGQLLIAEEMTPGGSIKVYSLEGEFQEKILGLNRFGGDAEGIALFACGREGYWIFTDQHPKTSLFMVFDRGTLGYLGTFRGAETAKTDGTVLTRESLPGLPEGAFYAVHDDQSVHAYDWREIAKQLELPLRCEATSEFQGPGSKYDSTTR